MKHDLFILFSVNAFSTTYIPNLFTRNERVVCWFNTSFGPMVVILVGAMLVASVHTVWAGQVAQMIYHSNVSLKELFVERSADPYPIYFAIDSISASIVNA